MVLWLIVAGLAIFLYIKQKNTYRRLQECSDNIPGPKPLPFLGNGLEFLSDSVGIFKRVLELSQIYGERFRIWNNGKLYVITKDPKDVEKIMSDNKNITKSDLYRFFIPWIGYGLLTSTGGKWKQHRRIITPTFYFKILEDFLEVFNKNIQIMGEKLESELDNGEFNAFPYVNRAALDNICETAMGVNFNIQKTEDSSYLAAIKVICETASLRIFKVWLMPNFLFNNSAYGKSQKIAIDFIHNFTKKLIKEKKAARVAKKNQSQKSEDDTSTRKKTAFLDLLIEYAGSELSDEEINDEVNTFMFEGHDTVSSVLSFAIHALANHPDVQEKLYQELVEVLGDSDSLLTMKDLPSLPYLDMVIKEALRMYPSVTMVGREVEKDVTFHDGTVVPPGGNIIVDIYSLHRNQQYWSNPLEFNPENFSPDQPKRHPFAYLPFSAGSRNCIGQKFATLEMKSTLSYIIRKFKLLPSTNPNHKLVLSNEIVLISKTGIHLRIQKRNS